MSPHQVLRGIGFCCSRRVEVFVCLSALLQQNGDAGECKHRGQHVALQHFRSNSESKLNRISSSLCGNTGGGWGRSGRVVAVESAAVGQEEG